MCATDENFDRSRAFKHLVEVKKTFLRIHSITPEPGLTEIMKSKFPNIIAKQMEISNKRMVDIRNERITEINEQVEEVKTIMVQNIESVLKRGERLDNLVQQSEHLLENVGVDTPWKLEITLSINFQTTSFRQTTTSLARSLHLRNIKANIMIALISLVTVYVVLSMFCGGLTLKHCLWLDDGSRGFKFRRVSVNIFENLTSFNLLENDFFRCSSQHLPTHRLCRPLKDPFSVLRALINILFPSFAPLSIFVSSIMSSSLAGNLHNFKISSGKVFRLLFSFCFSFASPLQCALEKVLGRSRETSSIHAAHTWVAARNEWI